MRRKLREAAKAAGDTLPNNECLTVMIHRWENGRSGISERYRLHYCEAFQIPADSFGDPAAGPMAGHPAASALPAEGVTTPAYLDEERLTAPGQSEMTAAEQLGAAVIRVLGEYLSAGPVQPPWPTDDQRRANARATFCPADQHKLWFVLGYVNCLLAAVTKEHRDTG